MAPPYMWAMDFSLFVTFPTFSDSLIPNTANSPTNPNRRTNLPIAIPIPVIVTRKIVPPCLFARLDKQRLVDTAKQLVRVVRRELREARDVLRDPWRRKAPHQVEHRVHDITHAE
jgi:hypothetical protein